MSVEADSSDGASYDEGKRACARHPALSQGLPADKRAAEREERLVDVGPFVIPHAETPKLIQPRKCALDHPPPSAQARPMVRTAHGEQRVYPGHPQAVPNCLGVVAAIAKQTARPPPRSPASAQAFHTCRGNAGGFVTRSLGPRSRP